MITLIRTNSEHKDFISLVKKLDVVLAERDGDDLDFYNQFNKIDGLKHVIIGYLNGEPCSCGAIKPYDTERMEVKRMFTDEPSRGKGMASSVLKELEQWAMELGYKRCILETGIRQPEAIQLYLKNGYNLISNYGQYEGVVNSRCFEKTLV